MRHVIQTDKRQATLNQIYNSVEFARFAGVGDKVSFISANNGIGVDISNSRDGCGGATTIDVKVYGTNGHAEMLFRGSNAGYAAVMWLSDKLVPAPVEDDRGHTYAPIGGERNPVVSTPPKPAAYTRC